MTDVAKQMYKGQPGTSIGNLYGPAPSGKAIVRNVHVANTTGTAATITLSIGSTGVDTAATRFLAAISVPANGSIDWAGFLVLESGDYITGKQGTGSALTVTISGVEQ